MGIACVLRPISRDLAARFRMDPEALDEYLEHESDEEIDLDKSWHAIHFLLTGDPAAGAEPNCFLVTGGEEVGEDLGYGPARLLTPDQVGALHSVLESLTPEMLRARFDPAAFHRADIYPSEIWKRDPMEESWEYITHYYDQLRQGIHRATESQSALLVYLS